MMDHDIVAIKDTGLEQLRWAAGLTTGNESNMTLERAYINEHSPARTQIFRITMLGIPTASSVHLVRHKVWIEHFVKSNRPDRGGDGEATRRTPVNHGMFCNAITLINMARSRLCCQASLETRAIMEDVVRAVELVDPDLAKMMVPNCVYRNGLCKEKPSCGAKEGFMKRYAYYKELFL